MSAMAFIGMIVVGVIIGVGFYKLVTTVTFRPTPVKYVYVTDSDGQDVVVDNSDK